MDGSPFTPTRAELLLCLDEEESGFADSRLCGSRTQAVLGGDPAGA